MPPANFLQDISPHARVATALAPFACAIVLRVILGKNRVTQTLLSVSTVWFVVNVLMAPYSEAMQRDLINLWKLFG